MAYTARAKRIEPGRYELSYGRGKKKLTTTVFYNDLAKGWCISQGAGQNDDAVAGPYGSLKQLKAAWGEWAEANYEGAVNTSGDSDVPTRGPTPPVSSGPPKFRRSGPPRVSRSGPPKFVKQPDPEPSDDQDHQLTAIDALEGLLSWAWRNRKDINSPPWDQGMMVLHRERPDVFAKLKIATP